MASPAPVPALQGSGTFPSCRTRIQMASLPAFSIKVSRLRSELTGVGICSLLLEAPGAPVDHGALEDVGALEDPRGMNDFRALDDARPVADVGALEERARARGTRGSGTRGTR